MSSTSNRFNSKLKSFKYNNKKGHKFSKNSKNGPLIKCHHCGRKGHKVSDCFYYKRSLNHGAEKRSVQTVQTSEPSTSQGSVSGFALMAGNFKNFKEVNLTFLINSGPSDHIVNREDVFSEFEILLPSLKISVAKNGTFICATKRGNINVTNNQGIEGVLEGVLYCPDAMHNLLSVWKMQQAGFTIVFDGKGVTIAKGSTIIMAGKPLNSLIAVDFRFDKKTVNKVHLHVNNVMHNDYELWHRRLGHIGRSKFIELKNKQMVNDVELIEKILPNDNICDACINGKPARLPFNRAKDKNHIKRPLFIIHCDVCGPITPTTLDNKNYYMLLVDEFTHYCVTYLITYTSEVFSAFQDFI